MTDSPPSPKRVKIETVDLNELTREELINKVKEQEKYVRYLEERQTRSRKGEDDGDVIELEEKMKQQLRDNMRRESTLVHRLATKEQELQDYINQIAEMKQAQTQNSAQLRSMLLDPAVNLVFQRMTKEMDESQEKLKQTQNELSAWKFTPDSQTGKRLMAKCRMLLQENEELGKVINSGKTAQLEGEIALQKSLVQEMTTNQSELDDLLGDLDEDVEGMQSMIYVLQQQLKDAKEQLGLVQEENAQLRLTQNTTPVATTIVPPTDVKPIVKQEASSFPNSPITDTVPQNTWTTHSDSKYEPSQQSHDCHMDNVKEQLETPDGNGNGEIQAMDTDQITSSDSYNVHSLYTTSTEHNHNTDQNDLVEQYRTTKTDAQLLESTDDLSQDAWSPRKPALDQLEEDSALRKSHEELSCSPDTTSLDKLGERELSSGDFLHIQNGVSRTCTSDSEIEQA
ncbi:pre-mRNA-splicing regulator WTAP-like isoform X1 [Mizuhopecten yessoensis]|uniref:pre-mRNA-splicing regulator WTAP-like isoform X1 n=1 Tax=Mizuhopecten yessoensis TaxID=6573 RepID=UPI000B45DC1B|nr:pre-mRNA-splicing regulator WTAP-like isoform X1 [Mizuhopecten yessoensis]